MATRLFGTNGIRGVVNDELTPEFVIKIAEAIGTYFKQGRILLGYDGRISNIMMANAVTSGLVSTGCDVFNAGLGPTPCIQYTVKNHKMDGGVMITASHNPPEYNGIKVLSSDGVEISRRQEIRIENIFFKDAAKRVDWQGVGNSTVLPNALDEYKEAIKKHVDVTAIEKNHYHAVVDAVNGVGGLVAPYLLRELGCQVTSINANIDGTFPNRPPEPRPENLQDLITTVIAVGADFGVAFDGDADRTIFVDDKGEVQWGDRTFALIEKAFLQNNPGETIVTPISSSQVVKEVAEEYGGQLVWTRVGSTIVSHTMKKLKAKLGGEENGGVFYGPHQPVRDGAMTIALMLEILARTGRSLSQLLLELPRYHLEKDKIECPNRKKAQVLKMLILSVKRLQPDTIDGVKLWFSDKSSILIRPSGTEPIYRFYAEAAEKERASMLVKEYKRKLQKMISENA
ncbi:MAG: phosphoglucosamine mutase [Candidatus Bathyarchaeota archaeon]|nr:MAG: phosphoglucosamine mutase [Candidatus Bathyarchaeota archaeon]